MKRFAPGSHNEPDATPVNMTGASAADACAVGIDASGKQSDPSSTSSVSPRTRESLLGLARLLGRQAAREALRSDGGAVNE